MIKALVYLVAGVVLFGLGWISHAEFGRPALGKVSSGGVPLAARAPVNPMIHTPPPQTPRPPPILPGEMQQLRTARQTVLQTNPDLAAEYKQIMDDAQAQQARLDADMIKADPKVAPVVAKLAELRKRSLARTSPTMPITR